MEMGRGFVDSEVCGICSLDGRVLEPIAITQLHGLLAEVVCTVFKAAKRLDACRWVALINVRPSSRFRVSEEGV